MTEIIVTDEAVKAATAAYAGALYDRVTPMPCTDDELMRVVLEAAVPLLGPPSPPGDPLTIAEREAIRLAGELYTLIADKVCGHGPTRDDDLAEVRAAVHHIQNWVKAQAAGRAYPGELRLMGETAGGTPASGKEKPA